MLFDTHIHLDRLINLQEEVDAAREYGVTRFLLPGIRPQNWSGLYQTAATISGVRVAPGVHPLASRDWSQAVKELMPEFLQRPETIAIGEIGLDSTIEIPFALQETVFREQLRIAIEHDLPVLLHCRRATGQLLRILNEERAGRVGGILHAFTGSLETAKEAIRLGFALGIGGPITWSGAHRVTAMVQQLPADWLVLETDAPDQAPHPHRGETNRPIWLRHILQRLSELRGWSPDETAATTTANARRVLRLTEKQHD